MHLSIPNSMLSFFTKQRLLIFCGIVLGGILLGLWRPYTPIPVPELNIKSLSGATIELSALRGKPLLINFWATDCAACIREIPHLTELYQNFHPKGLEIIGISMYYDIPSHVVEMTRMKQLPYQIALDLKGEYANAFGRVQLTPSTFLISKDGIILAKFIGALPKDLATQIEQLL